MYTTHLRLAELGRFQGAEVLVADASGDDSLYEVAAEVVGEVAPVMRVEQHDVGAEAGRQAARIVDVVKRRRKAR
jgi:hypothetical protein